MTDLIAPGEDVASFVADRLASEPEGTWVEGFGTIDEPTVDVVDADGRAPRALLGTWDVISLRASLSASEFATVLVARGGEVVAGLLTKGRARALVARLARPSGHAPAAPAPSPHASSPHASSPHASPPGALAEPPAPAPPVRPPEELVALREPAASPSDPGLKSTYAGGAALPPKPTRKDDWMEELYPEEGDRVNHFAFGACTVVGSDGERIRLQQDRDSRVREVALSMLKIAPPTVAEDGTRHWNLARKN